MTDKIDQMKKAKQGIIDGVKELHGEWRKTDPVGGLDEFFDSTLSPVLDAAVKGLGS